jgi:phosphoribosylformimino-5-aminoimidazole carboxamide ribotide isomerase
MDLVPVIDLKYGIVVHAVRGAREKYLPVQSLIASDARPATVARAFAGLGFRSAYVADLDAIHGGPQDWQSYELIQREGLQLWIDAGADSIDRMNRLAAFGDCHVVLGTESLPSIDLVRRASALIPGRIIASLDMKSDRVLARNSEWQAMPPAQLADQLIAAGVQRLILLDLDRVGSDEGIQVGSLCAEIHKSHPHVRLYVGGGVRTNADLDLLSEMGCDGALVATALHRNRIRV